MQGARRSVRPAVGARRGPPKRPRVSRARRPSRLKRALVRHPLLYRGLRLSLVTLIWSTIVLGLAVVYFLARVPDPIIAALDDRPPNVTVLASDGTVLAERGLRRGHVRLDALPPYLLQAA